MATTALRFRPWRQLSPALYDAIGTEPTQSFDNKNVGTNKTLTASGLVVDDGDSGLDYAIAYVPDITGVITAAPLTVTAQTDSRGYNGTTSSAVAPVVTGTLYDPITTPATQSFDNKNIGTDKTLTPSGLVISDGNGGLNYTITYLSASTGVITPAGLTITAVTNTKFYNGTTSAAAIPIVAGLEGSDTVTDLSETYDTPDLGTGKTLSVATYMVNDGDGGNNYRVSTVANHTGVILPPATQLAIHTEPAASAIAGNVFPIQTQVYVEDQAGELITGDNTTQVTVTLRVGAGPLLGTTTVTASGGIATFANLEDNKAETIILVFTAGGLAKRSPIP